mmetsp:Transcript_11304/g.32078  ORF Transcript_11304/g.32078 Transcript_11304/m.32078 type:complete len:83 (+) Transcript_11304:540-788(+)
MVAAAAAVAAVVSLEEMVSSCFQFLFHDFQPADPYLLREPEIDTCWEFVFITQRLSPQLDTYGYGVLLGKREEVPLNLSLLV